MRWRSADGVWLVRAFERDGRLRYEITRHDGLVASGWLTVLRAHAELDEVLVGLGGPPLEAMVEE